MTSYLQSQAASSMASAARPQSALSIPDSPRYLPKVKHQPPADRWAVIIFVEMQPPSVCQYGHVGFHTPFARRFPNEGPEPPAWDSSGIPKCARSMFSRRLRSS